MDFLFFASAVAASVLALTSVAGRYVTRSGRQLQTVAVLLATGGAILSGGFFEFAQRSFDGFSGEFVLAVAVAIALASVAAFLWVAVADSLSLGVPVQMVGLATSALSAVLLASPLLSISAGRPGLGTAVVDLPRLEEKDYPDHVKSCAELLKQQSLSLLPVNKLPEVLVTPFSDLDFLIELSGQTPNLALGEAPPFHERVKIGMMIGADLGGTVQGKFLDAGSERAPGGPDVKVPDVRFVGYQGEEQAALALYTVRVANLVGDCINARVAALAATSQPSQSTQPVELPIN